MRGYNGLGDDRHGVDGGSDRLVDYVRAPGVGRGVADDDRSVAPTTVAPSTVAPAVAPAIAPAVAPALGFEDETGLAAGSGEGDSQDGSEDSLRRRLLKCRGTRDAFDRAPSSVSGVSGLGGNADTSYIRTKRYRVRESTRFSFANRFHSRCCCPGERETKRGRLRRWRDRAFDRLKTGNYRATDLDDKQTRRAIDRSR